MPNCVRSRISWRASTACRLPSVRGSITNSSLPITMRPREGRSRKLMQRRNVLLPDPEAPISEITWPLCASKDALLVGVQIVMLEYPLQPACRQQASIAPQPSRDLRCVHHIERVLQLD